MLNKSSLLSLWLCLFGRLFFTFLKKTLSGNAITLMLRLLKMWFNLTFVVWLFLAGSSYCLLATHMVWMSLLKCWSDQMFLPLLAHRLWKLSLQILARYSVFIGEVRKQSAYGFGDWVCPSLRDVLKQSMWPLFKRLFSELNIL